MNITEQITNSLKQAIDNNNTLNFVYIKLTKKYVNCYINQLIDFCYHINVKDYMNGYECFLDDIGYLTYPSTLNSNFSNSLYNLIHYYDYRDITIKDGYFHIPINLYIQHNKLGVSYSNGTMLNVFGDSVQEIVDNLNTMCNNNPNFKLHLNEKFTNLLNKD